MKVQIEIDIPEFPETAEDWEIYKLEGCEAVAKNLTDALKECFKIAEADEAWQHMHTAMLDHRKYGCTDTEPRGVAREILAKYHPAFKNKS